MEIEMSRLVEHLLSSTLSAHEDRDILTIDASFGVDFPVVSLSINDVSIDIDAGTFFVAVKAMEQEIELLMSKRVE
jgi:hypothetical protein